MLKLTAELEMEEAGLQPFPEEEPNQEDPDEDNEKGELLKQEHTTLEDNHESRVPDSYPMLLSDQQSYQLYVQASKPAGPDLEDANVTLNAGADYADDNNTLYSQEIDIQHSRASDESLRRRRVRFRFFSKNQGGIIPKKVPFPAKVKWDLLSWFFTYIVYLIHAMGHLLRYACVCHQSDTGLTS